MHNENHTTKRPPRRGPGMGPAPAEKAKDFKSAVKRLFKELKDFRPLIAFALILAALSSILSIIAPNKLSDLTDKISEGLVINTKNFEEITEKVTENLGEEQLKTTIPAILAINLNEETTKEVMTSSTIEEAEKQKFQNMLASLQTEDGQKEMLNTLSELSDETLKIILPTSNYQDKTINTEDKIQLLRTIQIFSNQDNTKDTNIIIPESLQNILFTEFTIDGETISPKDQANYLSVLGTLNKKDATTKELYGKLDQLPANIKKVIEPTMNMDGIKKIALFLTIIYLCSALFNYIESISMTNVANKFARKLRSNISNKINKLPLKYFDRHQSGDILSRVTNDVDTIAQSMNQSLSTLVSAITLFVGTVIMMFVTNWIMAITAIVSSLLGFIFMFAILGKSQKYFVARQVELGNLNSHIEEVYSGLNVVKAYNGKKESDQKFDELNKKVYECNRKSQFLSGLMHPMMNFIGNFGYVAVCIVGALLTMNDLTTFGVIVAFIMYIRLFTSPLSQIAQAMTSLQSTAAASERVFEFMDEEEMSSQKQIKKVLDKKKVKGKIEFENVVFKYDGNDTPTIKNFSAIAKPGQKVAIVGPTGAGKTTMVNLLMKFYEINSGDIKIDGVSTKELTRENIHDLFTMVLQDTWLFNGTIKENIIYNRKNVTDKQVEEVCKTVGVSHFINTLSEGYDSIINDNDSVSAGQRQLITIARGMIEDAPFLILDEATSNVDTRTEELVQKAMDKLTEGRTSFIIAHRLSTIKNADLILVMKDGNIIETGTHNQLLKKNGFYAELYNSQFQNE
ncbi:MAG: ABC transporter ATP-binding protein/permease [Erysipelotrichaceae bacterium]|nr:ABC transporter ATP-binding protein/permease [Erysipelotrichaceae bacterium]